MPDALRPMAAAAMARMERRKAPPHIVTLPEHRDYQNLTCPYRDEDQDLWLALLLECFGTRVAEVGQCFFRQLEGLCPRVRYQGEEEERRDEEWLRQALAIVYSLKPRNEAEAAAAAQYVALHFASMKVGAHFSRYGGDARTAASLAALTKASAAHLSLLRGSGRSRSTRQVIRVERVVIDARQQHVHVGREGGGESGGQGHAASAERARARHQLPSPDEGRGLLSLPPGEGPEPLPAAWGREGIGGAEG